MTARAESVRATSDRILDAMLALFLERPTEQIRLEDVADRAGVTVPTVVRHFGNKDGLIAAAGAREMERVSAHRTTSVAGDLAATVSNLVEHYESDGALSLKLLAEEARVPAIATLTAGARALHRRWCSEVFADALAPLTGVARTRRAAQLVAVCDVQTWKLLRVDAGLSRRQTALALTELLRPLVEEA